MAVYCRFFQEVNGPVSPDDVFVVESGAASHIIASQCMLLRGIESPQSALWCRTDCCSNASRYTVDQAHAC